MLVLRTNDGQKIYGVLKVDVGVAALTDAKAMTVKLAAPSGKVLPDAISVDGVPGFRVKTPSVDISAMSDAVVVLRGRKLYLIMVGGSANKEVEAAVDQVSRSWHWTSGP